MTVQIPDVKKNWTHPINAVTIGAGAQVRYQWTPQWEVRSYVEYSRLMGDVASSPLVSERGSRDQVMFGLSASYSFDVKLW